MFSWFAICKSYTPDLYVTFHASQMFRPAAASRDGVRREFTQEVQCFQSLRLALSATIVRTVVVFLHLLTADELQVVMEEDGAAGDRLHTPPSPL